MSEDRSVQRGSAAKRLAILGALITGLAGIAMAVYSIIGGEATGAGALLAASALAFGLLAANVDRTPGSAASKESSAKLAEPERVGAAVEAAARRDAADTGAVEARPTGSRGNGSAVLRTKPTEAPQIDAEPLTDREHEVLALVAEGYANKRISQTLGISERTVKNHLTTTMGKLRASDRIHAVVTAVRLGWLDI